jgi:hypothetical protein
MLLAKRKGFRLLIICPINFVQCTICHTKTFAVNFDYFFLLHRFLRYNHGVQILVKWLQKLRFTIQRIEKAVVEGRIMMTGKPAEENIYACSTNSEGVGHLEVYADEPGQYMVKFSVRKDGYIAETFERCFEKQ